MDFFHFYTEIDPASNPFQMFSLEHIVALAIVFTLIFIGLYHLKNKSEKQIYHSEKVIVSVLLLAEFFYYGWTFTTSPVSPFKEMLPLHLCSICVYASFFAIYLDNEKLRRFVAVNNVFGAMMALCYPATIAGIQTTISYRVIYFFISHMIILFIGLLQIKKITYLEYNDLKFNVCILAILSGICILTNMYLQTDYLFVGTPPKIGIIHMIYNTVGILLYWPTAVIILALLQASVITIINAIQHLINKQQTAI